MQTKKAHIVVLGAGFGGLEFCQRIDSRLARVTVVDRQNHHLFQPLLYQVAAAGLAAPDIAQPVRSILSNRNHVTILLDSVTGIDLGKRAVICEQGRLEYDYLIIALGGVTSYFGHPEWEQFAPGLKSLDDAIHIRRRILLAFEQAENTLDAEERTRLMTIVVVGGGPTGVELAGAFAELARKVLAGDFRRINPAQARVMLIEASPRLLGQFPPDLSASAESQLRNLGVEVRTNTRLKGLSFGRVELADEVVRAENVIWAAGVSGNPLARKLGVELDRAGRIKVNADLSLPGHPQVFAIGDAATLIDARGREVPGVSPAAMQMAQHAARLIADEIAHTSSRPGSRPPFVYRDRGTMATIGRSAAVAQIGGLHFSGFPAWLAWLGVHLIFLIGFRNKIAVLFNWAYSYFTYKRGMRIITGLTEEARGGAQHDPAPTLPGPAISALRSPTAEIEPFEKR